MNKRPTLNSKLWTLNYIVLFLFFSVSSVLADEAVPARVSPQELSRLLQDKAAVAVDVMSGIECRDHRIPGSFCLPAAETAGKLGALARDKGKMVVFYGDDEGNGGIQESLKEAKALGYSRIGFLEGGLAAWKDNGLPVESSERIPRISGLSIRAARLSRWQSEKKALFLLDIRAADSFSRDHIAGAVNIPVDLLDQRYTDLPLDRMIVVVDENGFRSFLAASYLSRKGFREVARLHRGMEGWKAFLAGGK